MKVRWLWFLPVVAWSGVIVAFSSQNATESAGASAVYAEWIVRTVHWATGWPAWAPSAPGYPDLLHAVQAAQAQPQAVPAPINLNGMAQ